MQRVKNQAKLNYSFAIFFSILTILFFILYQVKVISYLDLYLAVIYIMFFVGLALFYNGAYLKDRSHTISSRLNLIFGGIFIIISTVGLIYGFASGLISFWPW